MSQTIHVAQVTAFNSPPTYTTIPFPSPPAAHETRIRLLASAVHRLVRSRASGTHYSVSGLPQIVGTDAVGLTIPDNKTVYFSTITPQGGSMAEELNVPTSAIVELPEGADPVKVAAMVNPAMSAWMALREGTDLGKEGGLGEGFAVLVLGVTSASGKLGVEIAKSMGAGRVVGVARNEAAIKAIEGVDEAVVLKEGAGETEWARVGEVDVVLDYLYGKPAEEYLQKGLMKGKRVQFVQIGSLAGEEIQVPSAVLRSQDVTLRGSGPGAWTMQSLGKETPGMVKAAAGVKNANVKVAKLADIEKVWGEKLSGSERLVFVP